MTWQSCTQKGACIFSIVFSTQRNFERAGGYYWRNIGILQNMFLVS